VKRNRWLSELEWALRLDENPGHNRFPPRIPVKGELAQHMWDHEPASDSGVVSARRDALTD
jgi:hypothetical protein